jgi:hypothetical protein
MSIVVMRIHVTGTQLMLSSLAITDQSDHYHHHCHQYCHHRLYVSHLVEDEAYPTRVIN